MPVLLLLIAAINHSNLTLIEKGTFMIKINALAPDFAEDAYINDQIKKSRSRIIAASGSFCFSIRQTLPMYAQLSLENWQITMQKLKQKVRK